MVQKFKNALLSNLPLRRIIENFFSLSLLNGISALFPLITLPFLVRVLGVEKYGVVIFAQAVVQLLLWITNYGFHFSGTQQISIYRNIPSRINTIFSSILLIRILLLTLVFVFILLPLLFFTEKFGQDPKLFLISFSLIIGDVLFPLYLFQGMEKMKYITIVHLISKSIFTGLVFVFIRTPDDYLLVNLFQSLGFIVAGVVSFVIALRVFNIQMRLISFKFLVFQIRAGFYVFLSVVGMNLYRSVNVIILGFLANDYSVGLYAAAEKAIKYIQMAIQPALDVLYPYFGYRFSKISAKENLQFLFKVGKYYAVGLLVISGLIFLFSTLIVQVLFGSAMLATVPNLQILSFVVLFGGLNFLFGINGMMNLNYKRQFTFFTLLIGGFNIVVCFVLIHYFNDKGASIALLASEGLLLGLVLGWLRRRIL